MSEERTNNLEITEEVLKTKILIIRGQQVMLDSDLAEIYGYTTKAFNQQVRNNLGKFDDDFRFQLTWDEAEECSRSKNFTLNPKGQGSNIKYRPWCFTESGIYMLMTVLKGDLATRQSKALMPIFTARQSTDCSLWITTLASKPLFFLKASGKVLILPFSATMLRTS